MTRRIAVAIALTLAPTAFAQTYIVPEGDCGAITLHATRDGEFPYLGESVAVDQVKTAYVFVQKRRVAVTPVAGRRSLDFDANVPDEGVVMAAVAFAPVVTGDETRTDHAKAFIRCGAIAPRDDWQRSVGLSLEIYPQWNGQLPRKPGDSMRFIVVDKTTNKLLRDLPMKLYRAGAKDVTDGVQDEHGGMNFRYEEGGQYMVTATYRRPDPQQPDHWLVDTTTLTFELK
jgi:hypothetical protein